MKDLHLVLHRQRVFYGVQALLGRAIVSRVDWPRVFRRTRPFTSRNPASAWISTSAKRS
jgi:hypothetical protein